MSERIEVQIGAQVRGENAQSPYSFVAESGTITMAWGLQPGTAVVRWAREAGPVSPILPLAAVTIRIGGHTFYGICEQAVAVESHDGRHLTQQFKDSRALLQYDVIYGQFNMRHARLVNGRYQRRFRHLLPAMFNEHRYTYTDRPYTAREILDLCFGAPTVETPWRRVYVGALNAPVLDVDAYSGKKLGTLVAEVSARCGATFTLQGGRYQLVWTVKGLGNLPSFPANSTARRLGLSATDNPTRVRILGDRNLYQVLDIPLRPDWASGWEAFWDVEMLADDLFRHERLEADIAGIPAGTRYNGIQGDVDGLVGRQLASARALTITVGEYAALREARPGGGAQFRDLRTRGGRSRMQMPAALYIGTILYRCYRLPEGFGFRNQLGLYMGQNSLEIAPNGIVDVSHDPQTGKMTADFEARSPGNGYAIARGYIAGQSAFKTLRPESFDLEKWAASQDVWAALQFQVDDSGEDGGFILFDEPVIDCRDAMQFVKIDGETQPYPVLKAEPKILPAPVRASLCFAGERFSYTVALVNGQPVEGGNGLRDDVEVVPGLGAQIVLDDVVRQEVPYADGEYAWQKAFQIGAALVQRQFVVAEGGYHVQGSNATQLGSMIDRVTVTLDAGGLSEEVDFVNERSQYVDALGRVQIEPVREFERWSQLDTVLPGAQELRDRANEMKLLGAALKRDASLAKFLRDTFNELMGVELRPETYIVEGGSDSVRLQAGCPLWASSGGRVAKLPGAPVSGPVFLGVTLYNDEKTSGPVRALRTGVVVARVRGPTSPGDAVGFPKGSATAADHLSPDTELPVGWAMDAVPQGKTRLCRVNLSGGGGGRGGGEVRMLELVSVSGDYLVAAERLYTNPEVGGAYVLGPNEKIAKPFELRTSNTVEIIAGATVVYVYQDAQTRTAHWLEQTDQSVIQKILPPYLPGKLIWAIRAETGVVVDGKQLEWLELDQGRVWARVMML